MARNFKPAKPVKVVQHKKHGPKRHLFKDYKPMVTVFAEAGLLDKFNCYDSFMLAMMARGHKNGIEYLWERYKYLSKAEKIQFLKDNDKRAARA